MKTKLLPLGLLIPAVVLAQPAPPAPQPPQMGMGGSAQFNAPNNTKAASAALVFKRVKSAVLSNATGVSASSVSFRKKIDGKTYTCTKQTDAYSTITNCYSIPK
jgi:hypothetical protein